MEVNGDKNSLMTPKHHKENFNNNQTVRLINLTEKKLGHISKTILDTTSRKLREAKNINQWTQKELLTGLMIFLSFHHQKTAKKCLKFFRSTLTSFR